VAINDRLKRLLDEHRTPYETLPHREVFTAQEVAEASHVSGRQLAKVLVVREEGKGGRHLMVVLPAACRLDLTSLREGARTRKLSLVGENELAGLFPDCELGAMPPFGGLYDLPVYIDACFPKAQDFLFQPGNHHEVVRIRYEDYERLVHPVVGEFCLHEREKIVSE
jgi:Ala-tRNA(Pro) deacylase